MNQENINIALVVDPDKEYREKIGRTLEMSDGIVFQVLWAATIKEAINTISKIRPSVIISELNFPDSRAAKTLAQYYNKAKGIPLVILSNEDISTLKQDSNFKNIEKIFSKICDVEKELVKYLFNMLNDETDDSESKLEGVRVLIIDDDSTTRYIQGDYLRQEGCVVEEAEDGFMALAVLRKSAITGLMFDVVIVDLMMPNMDGFEFLSTIRKRAWGKDVPLLVSSSRNDSEAIMKCKFSNIDGYIIKPATRDTILSKVFKAVHNNNKKD